MARRKRDHSDVPALPFDDRAVPGDGVTSSGDDHSQAHSLGGEGGPPVTGAPDFDALLRQPAISSPLPSDFSVSTEAQHLSGLWQAYLEFRRYSFLRFIHAGGSGMVFEVAKIDHSGSEAMKIARHKLFLKKLPAEAAQTLSPVSKEELMALEQLSHPNVVRLYNTLSDGPTVFAICTTFIADPANLDYYLRATLERTPKRRGVPAYSPERLETACGFLLEKCQEIASALEHMHGLSIYHFDIKPANILIPGKGEKKAMLTDMGSCIHAGQSVLNNTLRVHFTWTYAHPDLRDLLRDLTGISGGGLKVSAEVSSVGLAKYDLYAFGKTIQEALGILDEEFGERCYSSYTFRFLHLIACLLLDGNNAPTTRPNPRQRVSLQDGRRFVNDTALHYPLAVYSEHKITTAKELIERLQRFSRQYSWNFAVPELDAWQPDSINTGTSRLAPFTKRVAAVFTHPAVRRLRLEPQLGWIKEIYPSATHTRWAHTLGVFSSLVAIYNALLADPEVPTFRILADARDIEHAFVAAILHDVGQTAFGHDFESASCFPAHEKFVPRLLDETLWGTPTLRETVTKYWPAVELGRVLAILGSGASALVRPIDGIARDSINGPIDADKLDYLVRDSIACSVPYGHGMDTDRLLRALTVAATEKLGTSRLTLAYKAKGRPAIESMLFARYQMYGAVYWHHTFRCIQAMFVHAVIGTFDGFQDGTKSFGSFLLSTADLETLFYKRVICGADWAEIHLGSDKKRRPVPRAPAAPALVAGERALEFVWRFAPVRYRNLLMRLASRNLFRRVFEMRLGELNERGDYSALLSEFLALDRNKAALKLQGLLITKIDGEMRQRARPTTSLAENSARKRLQELSGSDDLLVVLDFPVRGLPNEENLPSEMGDPHRKYFPLPDLALAGDSNAFYGVRRLQTQIAAVRVFSAPELHELIIRYLSHEDVRACVGEVLARVK